MHDTDRFVLDEFTNAAAARLEMIANALKVRPITDDAADAIGLHVTLLAEAMLRCAKSPVETYPQLPRLDDLPPLPR